eukprot:gene8574-39165_t
MSRYIGARVTHVNGERVVDAGQLRRHATAAAMTESLLAAAVARAREMWW